MKPRSLLHQGQPLPALEGGQFAGSCRIQPLTCELPVSEVRWFQIAEVPLDQLAAEAKIRLVALDSVPKVEGWMTLTELTRPFTLIHPRLCDPEAGTRFALEAALVLHELEQPIRARLTPDGHLDRPAALFRLRGDLPVDGLNQGARLSVGSGDPAHWSRHLEKHLLTHAETDAWAETLRGRKWMVLRPSHLKAAARWARDFPSSAGSGQLDGLRPQHWPLLECYAELSMSLLESLLDHHSLHAARDSVVMPMGSPLWDELCKVALENGHLAAGEELLFAEPVPGRFVAARGPGGLSRPLRWRTSYAGAGERGDGIQRRMRALRARRGVHVAAWPK